MLNEIPVFPLLSHTSKFGLLNSIVNSLFIVYVFKALIVNCAKSLVPVKSPDVGDTVPTRLPSGFSVESINPSPSTT